MSAREHRLARFAQGLEICLFDRNRPRAIWISAFTNERHPPLRVTPALGNTVVVDPPPFHRVALGVLATLLLAGSVSDDVGRRPVLLVALGGLMGSTVLFMLAQSAAWLPANE